MDNLIADQFWHFWAHFSCPEILDQLDYGCSSLLNICIVDHLIADQFWHFWAHFTSWSHEIWSKCRARHVTNAALQLIKYMHNGLTTHLLIFLWAPIWQVCGSWGIFQGGGHLQACGWVLNLFYCHSRGCLNNHIFSNLGLCAAWWARFMCRNKILANKTCRIMHELLWIMIFGSGVRQFANNFTKLPSHEWKSLANRVTSDPKIVIHSN